MLLRIANLFNTDQVRLIRERLEEAGPAWADGRATAGHQGAPVKRNLQLAEDSSIARKLSAVVVGAPERHPLFLSAALPNRIYLPMFNRYDGAAEMQFGTHVDGAVRLASFFRLQSMVREDAQRALLFDLDMAIVRLGPVAPAPPSLIELTGCYHNLLRMWPEVQMACTFRRR